jgi:hypothetical protein
MVMMIPKKRLISGTVRFYRQRETGGLAAARFG